MEKRLSLLGATGSIGIQALDVAEKLHWPVTAMAAGSRVLPFEEQIRKFSPRVVAMADENAAADLKVRIADLPVKVTAGTEGLCEVASVANADMVLNSVMGVAGFLPTLAAVEAGHDVALANKETLVAGGAVVTDACQKHGVKLLPVDSEHSAIFQCLQGCPPHGKAKKLILTCSGGPFFGKTKADLEAVTLEQALAHPNWSMGLKITVDSATMMNKGLELIEAKWLFDMDPDDIDIIIHRESIVHSLVEYEDNSVIAQLGVPDMRIPIQYALTWPERVPSPVKPLSLAEAGKLTFFAPDHETFPAINLCREAIKRGGLYPAAVSGANEQAVALFAAGKLPFAAITPLVARILEHPWGAADSAEAVLQADRDSRQLLLELAGERV
ncbi:MAG: 1-deoxy-D-xylulose-5-phosphate reductoisomerase [Clostridia bacterium]|nr:1-deoxy-D-xylulose-5-phosphate reductoisomerase [Clostridia bacterium]